MANGIPEVASPALTVDEQVEASIRKWGELQKALQEAEDRAKFAEDSQSHLRGQVDILREQKEADTATIRRLQAQNDQLRGHMAMFASSMLEAFNRMGIGAHARPGSVAEQVRDGLAEVAGQETAPDNGGIEAEKVGERFGAGRDPAPEAALAALAALAAPGEGRRDARGPAPSDHWSDPRLPENAHRLPEED